MITYNRLPDKTVELLRRIELTTQCPLYFYGSVQRIDYIPNKSDIDIDIFTDNVSQVLNQIKSILQFPENKIKKTVLKINSKNRVIFGYKFVYTDKKHNLFLEISVFDKKYREDVLTYHMSKTSIPWYITPPLLALKYMFYTLNVIPVTAFHFCKKFLMDNTSGNGNNAKYFIM
jgi:hypothetical protein